MLVSAEKTVLPSTEKTVLPSAEKTVYPVHPSFRNSEVTASSDFEVRGGNGATKLQWRNRARERSINRSDRGKRQN